MDKRIIKLLFVFLILFTSAIGCAHTRMNEHYQGRKIIPDDVRIEYMCEKFNGKTTSEMVEETDDYVLWKIVLHGCYSINGEHDIIIDYYESMNTQKVPVIMVLPILGGSNYFANSFANCFAGEDFSAVIVRRQKKHKDFKNLDMININLNQIVYDLKQALDWIWRQPGIDSERIGVFGISMGSIKAALISSLDNRIKASVMCLVGGNLAEIIATSDEKGIVRRREAYMKKHDMSQDELCNILQSKITCDPINYAEYIDAKNSLMVLGCFDSVVPYKNGIELWERMGKPEKITLFAGHYTAILSLPYIKYVSYNFFLKNFGGVE
jgi:hypothetical protein